MKEGFFLKKLDHTDKYRLTLNVFNYQVLSANFSYERPKYDLNEFIQSLIELGRCAKNLQGSIEVVKYNIQNIKDMQNDI